MNPEEIVNEFVRRLVGKDFDGACELVTPDIEYDNVPMGKNFGPEGVKSVFDLIAGNVDTVEFVVHRQLAVGNVVVNERTDRFQLNGAWVDLPVAGFFEVTDDGKISLWRDYFDMPTIMNGMQEAAGSE
jgi:limonene-1,2-epoxide hydrolase